MLAARKIDHGGQLALGAIMLLSMPVLYFFGFLAGLFIIGVWQLISALFNTNTFRHSRYKNEIRRYWIFCFTDFALLVLAYIWGIVFNKDDAQVIYCIALFGAAGIAIYYLMIYRKLIDFISIRDELDGLTKSKH